MTIKVKDLPNNKLTTVLKPVVIRMKDVRTT